MRCVHEACRRWSPDLRFLGRAVRGLWFDDGWYCSTACLEAEARARLEGAPEPAIRAGRGQRTSRLGALLLHQRLIAPAALAHALDAQRASGLRLGEQLCRMGAVSRVDVLRALAAQAGVGYLASVEPAAVRLGPAGLSQEALRALGVVPIEADPEGRSLRVACPAPLPRLALAVLAELTGRIIDPLLVTDDDLVMLLKAYGTAMPDAPVNVTRTDSLGEAARRIAEAIRSGRARRMQPVRCEPWLWVRLEGESTREEIVLPAQAVRKERTWQAARIRH